MGGVRGAQHPGHPKPLLRLGSSQPSQIRFAEAQGARLGNLGLGPLDLSGGASRHDRPTFAEAAVDPFGGSRSADLVNGALHRQLHSPGRVGTMVARDARAGG